MTLPPNTAASLLYALKGECEAQHARAEAEKARADAAEEELSHALADCVLDGDGQCGNCLACNLKRADAAEAAIDAVYALGKTPLEQTRAIPVTLAQWVATRFVHVQDYNELADAKAAAEARVQQLREALEGIVTYRDRVGSLGFQLEKADHYIDIARAALTAPQAAADTGAR